MGATNTASSGPALIHEPFEQQVHGDALSPGFAGETGFGFTRDFETQGAPPVS